MTKISWGILISGMVLSLNLCADTLPCPAMSSKIVFNAGTYSGCNYDMVTQVVLSSDAVLSNSTIKTSLINTNPNSSIVDSNINCSSIANLNTSTTISSSTFKATILCVNAQGAYSFSGSSIRGDMTNASLSFLQATGAESISFLTYGTPCQ